MLGTYVIEYTTHVILDLSSSESGGYLKMRMGVLLSDKARWWLICSSRESLTSHDVHF